jgi:hypothetical protein
MAVDSLDRVGAQTPGGLSSSATPRRIPMRHSASARPFRRRASRFGSTRTSCEAATRREGQPTYLMVHLAVQV